MPILKDKKVLFIHIPKTGGTYVENQFKINHSLENLLLTGHNDSIKINEINFHLQHLNFSLIVEKGYYSSEFLNSCYKFTFIRNPYTRTLSEYFFINRNLSKFDPDVFHKFVKMHYSIPKQCHCLSQNFFFDIKYDYVGKFETLVTDLKEISKLSGLNYEIQDVKINCSKFNKNELISLIRPDTIMLINDLFKEDFKLGNYDIIIP